MSDRHKTFRPGFTTVEVLVALAIVAVLSAIVIPEIVGRIRESRQSALSQTFFGLSQGIAEYRKAVTRYPYQLILLTQAPVLLDPTAKDACGNNLNASHINNWRGPYVSRQLLSTGIAMGDAQIENQLRRITVGSIDSPNHTTPGRASPPHAGQRAGRASSGAVRSFQGGAPHPSQHRSSQIDPCKRVRCCVPALT